MSTAKEEMTARLAPHEITRPSVAQRQLAKPSHWGAAVLGLSLLWLLAPGKGSAQWVAYNDHSPGTNSGTVIQTHTNATIYNVRGITYTNSGFLKDIATGTNLPVMMTYSLTGSVQFGNAAGVPNAGTPLDTNFDGYVYFGGGTDSHIEVASDQAVTITFTGLNPNKRYSFRGGAVRGNSTYTNRWTKALLIGADSYTNAHSAGVLTREQAPSDLQINEAAINTGLNLAGDMWDWENIDPGLDGAFSVVCTQYKGFVPGSDAFSGIRGYGISGIRLEEKVSVGPMVIIVEPTNQVVFVGEPFSVAVEAGGAPPYYYQWFQGMIPGTAIVDATNQTYSVANAAPGHDGYYYVIVSNDTTRVTSRVARIILTNDFPLLITKQPQSTNVPAGIPVTFTVEVSGTRPCYQWLKNGAVITNATNASYTISSASSNDVGNYSVRITNLISSAMSVEAPLAVDDNVALLVARTNLSGADMAISNRLVDLGYVVTVQDDRTAASSNALNKALVLISASVDPAYVASKFLFSTVPVMVWDSGVFNTMGLTSATTNQGTVTGQQGLYMCDSTYPIAAGLSGTNRVFTSSQALSYGIPGANAVVVAATTNGSDLPVLFAYEQGAILANLFTLPARRVGFFLENHGATNLTAVGWSLFDTAVQWATGTPIATNVPVGLSTQPTSLSVVEGLTGTISVNVTGTPPYYLQWRKNGTNIAGATGRALRVGPVTPEDNGAQFTLYVTNKLPSYATSLVATLTVLPVIEITITNQPQNLALDLGQTATFTVGITGTAAKFQWYKNGVVIPNATNQTYTIPSVTLNDNGSYYVVATNRVSSRTSGTAVLFVRPPTQVIVATTNVWRYNTNGVELQTAWRTNGYDDNSWAEGPGVLAYPTNEWLPTGWTIKTVLPLLKADGTNRIQTYYFRTHFTWTNEPGGVLIVVTNLIDDGAIFYLNGEEISRVGMPSGNITYDTPSTRASDVSSYGAYVFTISPFLLQPGDNVLAVEVHQGGTASADVVFGSTMGATFIPPTMLAITNQPQGVITEETRPATFRVGVVGEGARFQWYKEDAPVPGARRDFLTISNASLADAGNYFVTVSNAFSSLVSSKAALVVLVDTNPPALLEAELVGETNILVSFSELVLGATATNLANYAVTNYAGGTLEVHSAVLLNPTNVLLTITAPSPGANYVLLVSHIRDVSPQSVEILANSAVPVTIVLELVSPYSYYEFYNPVPPYDEPNIGTEWRNPEFVPPPAWGNNDAERGAFWLGSTSLPVALGKELSPGSARTSYFRTWFNFDGSPWGAKLRLRHVTDSGAVFYLNGQEISRFNLPTGAVDYATPADLDIPNASWSEFVDVPVERCRPSPNLLAIELHTAGSYQATEALAVELEARLQSFSTGLPCITRQPQGQTVTENEPVTFRAAGVGATRFQWFQNGTPIPGATQQELTIPSVPLSLDGSAFYVLASNETGMAVSSLATLRVSPDLAPPVLVSAFALSSNQVLVNFSEPLDPATATNVVNYFVLNNQYASLPVYRAVVTNDTNVLLTFVGTGGEVVLVSNVEDRAVGHNTILTNSAARLGLEVDLPFETLWKYDQSGREPGADWKLPAFADGDWSTGAGSFWIQTDVPPPRNTQLLLTSAAGQFVTTYYFRTHVIAPYAVSNVELSITHVIDDGVIFYLNGNEFQRYNMNGAPTYTNLAATSVEPISRGPFTTNVNLLAGDNVIAAEVHQAIQTSTDVGFGAEIKITVPSVVLTPANPAPTWLRLQSAGPGKFLSWTGRGFVLEKAEVLLNSGQTSWTPVDVVDAPTNYYWLPATGSNAFYRLRF